MSAPYIGRRTFVLGALTLPALAHAAAPVPLVVSGSASVCRLMRRAFASSGIPMPVADRLRAAVLDGTSSAVTVAKLSGATPPSLVLLDGPTLIRQRKAGRLAVLEPTGIAAIDPALRPVVQGSGTWLNYVRPWYGMAWPLDAPSPPCPTAVPCSRPWDSFAPWISGTSRNVRRLLLPRFEEANAPYLLWMAARSDKPDIALDDAIKDVDASFSIISSLAHSRPDYDVSEEAMLARLPQPAKEVASCVASSAMLPAIMAGARAAFRPSFRDIGRTAVPFGIAKAAKAPASTAADSFLVDLFEPSVQAALFKTFHEAPRLRSGCDVPPGCPACPMPSPQADIPVAIPDWEFVSSNYEIWSARWEAARLKGD